MSDLLVLEQTRLAELEAVIEHGLKTFVDVGNALLEIRDSRLYRAEFGTFEDYCRERWGWERRHAYRMIDAAAAVENVSNWTQTPPANEAQARPLTSLPPQEQIRAWEQVVDTAPPSGITAAHVQSVVNQFKAPPVEPPTPPTPLAPQPENKPHVSFNSGNNEWYTPTEYIEAARNVMGEIELDPASSDIANKTVQAIRFYTIENDGLLYNWRGKVWMNPPYGAGVIDRFTEKLAGHYRSGDISEAIVLVNNATETNWFQSILACCSAICFVNKRIRYVVPDGNQPGSPLQGQAILYFGINTEDFAAHFAQFGGILYAK